MNTASCCPATIPLVRPLHERLLDGVTGLLRTAASAWRERAERRRAERQLEAIADMNELMLRDIGAPDWMVANAAARRDSQEMRMFELQFARDMDVLRGLK